MVHEDVLISSQLFLKTLGVLLKHRDGIVINLDEDLQKQFNFGRAIVYNLDGQIGITEEGMGFNEGQRLHIS